MSSDHEFSLALARKMSAPEKQMRELKVYVDPSNSTGHASDDNDGTESAPVSTFARVNAILSARDDHCGVPIIFLSDYFEAGPATKPTEDYERLYARASQLADEAGALRTERDELLRENAVLRRKLERLEARRPEMTGSPEEGRRR